MKDNRRKQSGGEASSKVVPLSRPVELGQVLLDVRAELREMMVVGGMAIVAALMTQDVEALCGPRYARKPEETATRWGEQKGTVVLGGRKVQVTRPRVRRGGKEVPLPTYQQLTQEDPLDERALEQMLIGVSTRKYQRSLEPVTPELLEKTTSKSEVSRRFVAMTEAQLQEMLSQPLGGTEWTALMLDGITFAEHVIVVALGIDATGRKQVLGLREGSTENATLCRELLAGLVERGFPSERSILVTLDGGKGLHRAVKDVFGDFAVIQRCQVHKTRNVLDHLPEELQEQVRRALNQAYAAGTYELALRQLQNQARSLAKAHPGAADSLREGMEETLAIKLLGLPQPLARSLATTNPIENMNGTIRFFSSRVKRWANGNMVLRWAAAGASEAQRGFRRLKGHAEMSKLVAALKARDEQMKQEDVRRAG